MLAHNDLCALNAFRNVHRILICFMAKQNECHESKNKQKANMHHSTKLVLLVTQKLTTQNYMTKWKTIRCSTTWKQTKLLFFFFATETTETHKKHMRVYLSMCNPVTRLIPYCKSENWQQNTENDILYLQPNPIQTIYGSSHIALHTCNTKNK